MIINSFNPHTHTGCDLHEISRMSCSLVSIHTPIQGVTGELLPCAVYEMFQSTHPYRVWLQWKGTLLRYWSFNPHTHTGCDIAGEQRKMWENRFNPHTHTGCDNLLLIVLIWMQCFNPHTHTGCDVPRLAITLSSSEFQSTHPYRVWLPARAILTYVFSFNPHTHTGCDILIPEIQAVHRCFNPHTHTGCDKISKHKSYDGNVSIHTPIQGVTAYSAKGWISRCKDRYFAKNNKIITHKII